MLLAAQLLWQAYRLIMWATFRVHTVNVDDLYLPSSCIPMLGTCAIAWWAFGWHSASYTHTHTHTHIHTAISSHEWLVWGSLRLAPIMPNITPRACARGKAIGFVCLLSVIVITTKIARSGGIGIWATRKQNKSVEFSKKLASICFESFGTAHKCRK